MTKMEKVNFLNNYTEYRSCLVIYTESLGLQSPNVLYLTPESYSASESEYDGNVEVGCTLSLVDRVAMQDSLSEYTTTTDSDYTDEDGSDVSFKHSGIWRVDICRRNYRLFSDEIIR